MIEFKSSPYFRLQCRINYLLLYYHVKISEGIQSHFDHEVRGSLPICLDFFPNRYMRQQPKNFHAMKFLMCFAHSSHLIILRQDFFHLMHLMNNNGIWPRTSKCKYSQCSQDIKRNLTMERIELLQAAQHFTNYKEASAFYAKICYTIIG